MKILQLLTTEKEKGMVLVTGLVFLLILTVLGISGLGATVMNEKMSQNLKDSNTAFSAAETALSDGETWVNNQTGAPTPVTSCSTPPCQVWNTNILSNIYQQSTSWWATNGNPLSTTLPGVSTQPYYIVELSSLVPYELSPDALSKGQGYYYYRVTARGTGTTGNSTANVQSIFAAQFN